MFQLIQSLEVILSIFSSFTDGDKRGQHTCLYIGFKRPPLDSIRFLFQSVRVYSVYCKKGGSFHFWMGHATPSHRF